MICVLLQECIRKTMSTLTRKYRLCQTCVTLYSHHSMLKMDTTLFLIALCTVISEPDKQVFFNKLLLCQTFLLGLNQTHVVVSLGVGSKITTVIVHVRTP